MNDEEIRPRRPVMRRATEAACPGWTPIGGTPGKPPAVVERPAGEPAAPASPPDGGPLAEPDGHSR